MRISVISPTYRSGNSTVASMLAQCLAATQNFKVVLTYTGDKRDVSSYLGVHIVPDKTRTISQVVRLLENRQIDPEQMYDYAIRISPNLYLLDTYDETVTAEDKTNITAYAFESIESDVTICDVNTEIMDKVTQEMFKLSDVVCFVINPDTVNYNTLEEWKKSEYWPKTARVLIIVNKYDDQIEALRNISRRIGVAHMNVCKLHYNPMLTKFANEGNLSSVMKYILEKDPQVIELNNDFKECTQYVSVTSGYKFKWEV